MVRARGFCRVSDLGGRGLCGFMIYLDPECPSSSGLQSYNGYSKFLPAFTDPINLKDQVNAIKEVRQDFRDITTLHLYYPRSLSPKQ